MKSAEQETLDKLFMRDQGEFLHTQPRKIFRTRKVFTTYGFN